jgi:PhnB protein
MTLLAPAPERYRHAVIAHIMLEDASAAIEFYQQALSATELFRIASADGRILHAEISVGGAVVMVGDAEPPFVAPTASGSTTVGLHVYLDDVDTALARAEQAGAIILQPAQDMFYGDRAGMLQDPFGHIWVLLTHQEDLDPAEIKRRGEALLGAADPT